MKTFNYTVKGEERIHARPAGLLVKEASNFKSSIKIALGEKSVDAKKLFGIMGLGVKSGDTVTIIAEGDDEVDAAVKLEELMKSTW